MVTMLAMNILQKVWLCTADNNLGYMNKTMFTLIALDYLISALKVKRSAKILDISWKLDFLIFVSFVTAGDSGTLLFPIGYRQSAWAYPSISRKINYTSQSVAMVTTYSELSTCVCLVF